MLFQSVILLITTIRNLAKRSLISDLILRLQRSEQLLSSVRLRPVRTLSKFTDRKFSVSRRLKRLQRYWQQTVWLRLLTLKQNSLSFLRTLNLI